MSVPRDRFPVKFETTGHTSRDARNPPPDLPLPKGKLPYRFLSLEGEG